MRSFKRALALILIAGILTGMFPGFLQVVHADSTPLNVESYSNGKLTLNWSLGGVNSVLITYHSPDAPGNLESKTVNAVGADFLNSASVENLRSDYIYDINIKMFDAEAKEIGSGTIFFLPQISFYGEIVKQQSVTGTSGGTESGVMPALKLSWKVPKIYSGTGFVTLNSTSAYNRLDSRLARFNYKINISDSINRTDIDIINDIGDPQVYRANVSGDNTRVSNVKYDGTAEKYYFYLLGVKEDTAHLPTITEVINNSYDGKAVLPVEISSKGENAFVLPDREILPGTVYYMKINPYPTDNTFDPANHVTGYIDSLSTGPSGSPMLGTLSYIHTPIRFELTKDSMDNINVKIYRINKGNQSIPQLYYEVQLNSVPSDQDNTWNQGSFKDKGKKLDGTYFTGAYAYTVITGISPNNTVYYRVVVKSNSSSDRLESMKMEYTLKDDISKPPVPKNVAIASRQLVTQGNTKSTNVTITWDKPSNWDSIISNTDRNQDIVFHFMLNTNQSDLATNTLYPLESGGQNYGRFEVKYRLVNYVSARSSQIIDRGNRLEYTMQGFNLFEGQYWSGTSGSALQFTAEELARDRDPDNREYPDFLLPNKTYYLQVYTTKAADKKTTNDDTKMSYKSLTVSFTTLTGTEKDVPLPSNFKISSAPTKDTAVLQFDKVKIDWSNYTANHTANDKIYYDLYMSTRTDTSSFIRIGTTELMNTELDNNKSDIAFDRVDDIQSNFIKATINKFRPGVGAYDHDNNAATQDVTPNEIFGDSLMPNTTYYFIVKTRLVVQHPLYPINPSVSTVILPVTTDRGDVGDPDTSAKRPLAPTDFVIAKDSNGNLILGGQNVTFNWSRKETGVRYSLICTSEKVAADADPASYTNDPIYKSFIAAFGAADNNTDNDNSNFTLDPAANPPANNFEYSSSTQTFKLNIDTWLFPNKLYYFSLRAETGSGAGKKESVWVSIPVTTSLIETPTMLAPVNDAELGFYWNGSAAAKAEDYKIYLKGPKDNDYKLLTRNQFTVTKDGTTCYGRLFNLTANTSYSIKVYEGNSNIPVFNKTGLSTRDGYHQIELKWKGLPVDPYTKYEVAIKTADAAEYTVLADSDLEQYLNINGSILPYSFEKNAQTLGTNYNNFYARIKTAAVTLADGTVIRQPLKSNMKYYIKVRAVKYDPANTALISYSKYIGPVDTRTEFNQKDYDDIDEDNVKKATFLDKIAKLEEKLFWRVGMSNTAANKILLKGDRMVNAMQNNSGRPYMLDISNLGPNINMDVIYMPVNVAKTLNIENKSLVIKTFGAEYTLRPRTLDMDNTVEIPEMKKKQGVNDLFLKVTVSRSEYPDSAIPKDSKRVSKVQDFEVQVLGSSKTDVKLKEEFKDKVYNDKTGLVKQKTDLMSNPYNNNTGTPEKLNRYIEQLVRETESELSDFINSTIEGVNGSGGMVVAKEDIKNFNTPMLAKLAYTDQKGLKLPYVLYDGSSSWQKVTKDLVYATPNSITFSTVKTGKYAIFALSTSVDGIADGHWAKGSINKFVSKFDLSDVFAGIKDSFNPETSVSSKEMILLYEKVMNKAESNTGMDPKQKAREMDLDEILNLNSLNKDISRQEACAILMKAYCAKIGVGYDSLKPARNIGIEDEWDINTKYYGHAVTAVDLDIMKLDDNGNFRPEESMTRAEVITAFVKVLELAGEI
ncbi:MAG: S-layer homology domain-containing protein [Clostridia bacterium]|nr:S-layer homology domain-containing protein [Clostridia bacterium]